MRTPPVAKPNSVFFCGYCIECITLINADAISFLCVAVSGFSPTLGYYPVLNIRSSNINLNKFVLHGDSKFVNFVAVASCASISMKTDSTLIVFCCCCVRV